MNGLTLMLDVPMTICHCYETSRSLSAEKEMNRMPAANQRQNSFISAIVAQ